MCLWSSQRILWFLYMGHKKVPLWRQLWQMWTDFNYSATEFRCGGRFYFIVFRSLPTNPKVNELLKSVHICQSYRKNKSDTFLWPTVYICLTDLLTIQCEIHKRTSKLTATLRWTCRNARTAVDSWELRVRNLTWEQNNYDYPEKKFKCNGGAFTWLPTFDVLNYHLSLLGAWDSLYDVNSLNFACQLDRPTAL